MTTVYRLISANDWQAAQVAGEFRGSAHDRRDGFIHFSTKIQVGKTLLRHFAGQHDLLLISFESAKLGEALRFELSRDGALFPHLYGELQTSLALEIVELV